MTNNQVSYIGMVRVTDTYLDANPTITALMPGFLKYFTPLKTEIVQAQAIHEQQEFDKKGITADKNQQKATLIALAIDTARRIVAYATNTNNAVLLAEARFTESELKKSPDAVLKERCQVILDLATENADALEEYGVTAASLTLLKTTIDSFNTAIPKPRLSIADKKKATDQLATLCNAMAANLEKIDTLVEIVRTTHPDFYKEYKSVRKIIDTGKNSLALKIKVTDAQTGEPLANTTLTITPDNGTQKTASQIAKESIVKKTAAGGGLNVKSIEDGSYTVTASKPGYKNKSVTVNVVNEELAVLEIEMEKA